MNALRDNAPCSVDGCTRRYFADNLCQAHYMRRYRTGKVGESDIAPVIHRQTCDVTGCDSPHFAHGYCKLHCSRFRRTGDPVKLREYPDTCTVEGCNRKHDAKGYCKNHYNSRRYKEDDYKPRWSTPCTNH